MTKAYIYRGFPFGEKQELVCATFDNGSELITIPHEPAGIFLQDLNGALVAGASGIDVKSLVGANTAVETILEVGQAIKGVWRPGLRFNIDTALEVRKDELARSKIDLKVLAQKLDDILLYVESSPNSLATYGHKLREFLILACTEVENFWSYYIALSGKATSRLTTNDYVALCAPLYLKEFEVIFTRHPFKQSFKPFEYWNVTNPTTSLSWYDAYNQAKHNKNASFDKATLENCLNAIAANIILFCIRFSPYELTGGHDNFANLINEHFEIKLNNPDFRSFYVPFMKNFSIGTGVYSGNYRVGFQNGWDWTVLPFSI